MTGIRGGGDFENQIFVDGIGELVVALYIFICDYVMVKFMNCD